jgi:acetyl esterase
MLDNLGVEPEEIYVDPQMAVVIERMLARMTEREPFGTISPELMRERFNQDISPWNENPPEVARVVDGVIEGSAGPLNYRFYDPLGDASHRAPCLLHFHGGGWIVGDHLCNDRTLRLLANQSGVSVLSVDYRLAPEHKFPAGLDDCVAVARHVHEQADEFGIDSECIGISGDSAGGNLTLATALQLRDSGENWLKFLLLIYPALSPSADSWSHRRLGNGDYGLGSDAMEFFWNAYLGDERERSNPLAAPLLADFSGLPPTTIVTGGLDALQCDAFELEAKMTRARVENTHRVYPGVIHGFFSMTNFLDVANVAVKDAASDTIKYLANASGTPDRGR